MATAGVPAILVKVGIHMQSSHEWTQKWNKLYQIGKMQPDKLLQDFYFVIFGLKAKA